MKGADEIRQRPFAVDPTWLVGFASDLGLEPAVAARIDERLVRPSDGTLAAADDLGAKWFMAIPPPARGRAGDGGGSRVHQSMAAAEGHGPGTPSQVRL